MAAAATTSTSFLIGVSSLEQLLQSELQLGRSALTCIKAIRLSPLASCAGKGQRSDQRDCPSPRPQPASRLSGRSVRTPGHLPYPAKFAGTAPALARCRMGIGMPRRSGPLATPQRAGVPRLPQSRHRMGYPTATGGESRCGKPAAHPVSQHPNSPGHSFHFQRAVRRLARRPGEHLPVSSR